METYKLSDSAIAQIAKLLQVALLTGTDVVDNLRTMELTVVEDLLEPSQEFLEQNEKNVETMLGELEEAGLIKNEEG